jgi:hypothetical protein
MARKPMSRVGLQADEAERGDGGVCEFGLIRGCQTRLVSATRKFARPSIGRDKSRNGETSPGAARVIPHPRVPTV